MQELYNNCPAGHGEMQLATVKKEIQFRGESIHYDIESLVCSECGLLRSTVEQTAKAQTVIADAYRQKMGLLTGDQIRQLREQQGLSQQRLADLANCSKMSIVRWENGVIQKESSDKALRDVLCPSDVTNEFSGNRDISLARIKLVYQTYQQYAGYDLLIPCDKGLFAAKNCWYADLIAYRELGRGITGATYAVLPYGPQLDNYADLVDEILKADTSDAEPLSEQEIDIIKRLSQLFPRMQDAYDAAHAEPAWKAIEDNHGQSISYKIAYDLQVG